MKTKLAFKKNHNDQHRRINKLWLCLPIFLSSIILTSVTGKPGKGNNGNNCNNGNNQSQSSLTFPREGDEPDGEGVYHYKIDSISLNGNTITIEPDDGEKVYFYVSGDITVSGKSKIINEGNSGDFKIYGKPDDGDNEADQTFSLHGKTCIDAFIYAPDAKMGINGGGKGCSGGNPNEKYNIYGAVWVKEWGLSKSNAAGILVPDELKDGLGSDVSVFNKSGSVSTWQREEVSP
ncbi:MAG: hypothetical protein BRC41_18765 [Cyanobacteria bacterium QH_9_48_43]|nr:MAG: hypothetical protein BRC41_18765 [Cyanobacteria bacterium QH_9_48_43]